MGEVGLADFLTEEEQAERIRQLWRDYGLTIVLALVLGIGGIIGWNFFQDHRAKVAQERANIFVDFETARGLLGPVEELAQDIEERYPNSSYQMFVLLYQAKDAVDEDNYELALEQLNGALELAKDKTFQSMIRMRKARVEFQLNKLDEALSTVGQVGAGYELLALELTGDIYRARGEIELAATAYTDALELSESFFDEQRIGSKLSSLPRTLEDDSESNSSS